MNEPECKVDTNGTKHWFLNGKRHRENGPAIEWADESKYWYHYGQLHREGGQPAIEDVNGTKHWFLNGKRHRENGPAIEWADGTKQWFLNGVMFETPDKMPLSLFLAYVKWMRDNERA